MKTMRLTTATVLLSLTITAAAFAGEARPMPEPPPTPTTAKLVSHQAKNAKIAALPRCLDMAGLLFALFQGLI